LRKKQKGQLGENTHGGQRVRTQSGKGKVYNVSFTGERLYDKGGVGKYIAGKKNEN